MRIFSVNVLIAAVAFADICSLIYGSEQILLSVLYDYDSCLFDNSYWKVWIDLKLDALAKCARKCSTWFSFFVVLIRTLVVRNPLDSFYENLANPPAAYKIVMGVVLLFSPLFVIQNLEIEIDPYTTNESICFPNQTVFVYATIKNVDFLANDKLVMKIFDPVNSVLTNVHDWIIMWCFLPEAKGVVLENHLPPKHKRNFKNRTETVDN
ncbi:unnamed protein product [Caenorhabditis nigoni]